MSNVSKLVIKACRDNKFSSFTGEFITSINPEKLAIRSVVPYYISRGMPPSAYLLKYCGSHPRVLSFSLLFDNTGIVPASNTISVMEQLKQLEDLAYSVQKKNNAPNYIRVIWGQMDFKGRLECLNIAWSMFQVDGTLVRAEAHIDVLEELVPVRTGKSAAGVDSNYAKASGASATSNRRGSSTPATPSQEVFAPTPNGMNGAYSGAPPGAYDGGPDQVYQGSNGGGKRSRRSVSSADSTSSKGYDSGYDSGSDSDSRSSNTGGYGASPAMDHSGKGFKGGVAGNGPGGSGGGIGGGGHIAGSGAGKPGGGAVPAGGPASRVGSSSHGAGSSPAGSPKKGSIAAGPDGVKAAGKGSGANMGKIAAAGAAGGATVAAAAAVGANSLRKGLDLKGKLEGMKEKASFFRRLQKFLKKVVPKKVYEAGKELGKKI